MGVFCHGYINGISISKHDRIYSYAEADNWSDCDTSDLVTAFRYYCKSRNLALEGSVADALTSFTTTTFNNICSTLGIDPTQLQAELKKTTIGNLGLRFLFSQTGITAYNRIFAEFLQNNDLAVGDEVENKSVFNGDVFTDDNGNSCLIWNLNMGRYYTTAQDISLILTYGSYLFDSNYLYNDVSIGTYKNYSFTINNTTYAGNLSNFEGNSNGLGINHISNKNFVYNGNTVSVDGVTSYDRYAFIQTNLGVPHGGICVFHLSNDVYYIGNIMLGNYGAEYNSTKFKIKGIVIQSKDLNSDNVENTNVYVTTNNNTINNNNYNNNYTIIYHDGDTYISDDDDEPLPTTPPGGGGGDPGGGPGGDPDNWNPTTPTIPDPTNPGFPTVDLPDIDIPNLPSLNFSLGDLRNKFPFSLPFDIIAILNVLDGEPQAPHIEATVPIGKWYTWEMDFDFSEYDNYARIFRAFEFIGFCIGLAVFTVHFVKG